MKIDFTRVIQQMSGQPLKYADNPGAEAKDMTLAVAAVEALLADEQGLPAAKKVERFAIASEVHSTRVAELTVEQVAEIKLCIGRVFGPLIVGQAYKMLDAN